MRVVYVVYIVLLVLPPPAKLLPHRSLCLLYTPVLLSTSSLCSEMTAGKRSKRIADKGKGKQVAAVPPVDNKPAQSNAPPVDSVSTALPHGDGGDDEADRFRRLNTNELEPGRLQTPSRISAITRWARLMYVAGADGDRQDFLSALHVVNNQFRDKVLSGHEPGE